MNISNIQRHSKCKLPHFFERNLVSFLKKDQELLPQRQEVGFPSQLLPVSFAITGVSHSISGHSFPHLCSADSGVRSPPRWVVTTRVKQHQSLHLRALQYKLLLLRSQLLPHHPWGIDNVFTSKLLTGPEYACLCIILHCPTTAHGN